MNRIFQADDDHKPSIERTYLDFAKILLAKANDLLEARGPVGLSGETSVRVRKLAREFLRGALTYLPHQAESAFLLYENLPRKPWWEKATDDAEKQPDPHALDARKLEMFSRFQLDNEFDEMLALSAGWDYPDALEVLGTDTDDPVRDAQVRARANWWRGYLNADGD